ncbi:membrane protein, putative accessory subunit of cytochrome c oxidase [Pseudoxanthomonas suwonensis 11-1]|uniref:Membrane protein, putative accessory subunit of cytochrome c oxidase n=1 Tax=Pseudoxanthomonas suwonensis (strain 11-1) TaxID=743721 RepID=E6WSP2_PSEUU|nr:hypothetical protein [Pseudoxanthomonas suwonensis]ADV27256.1 membrane protein, putative accessory subunit of cytochrome c oxidase [Pseudoxanthomonas suwonensis 11-1]
MAGFARPSTLVGIAAPMAVWALHFVVLYSLQGLTCGEGWNPRSSFWAMVALTIPALAVIAWLGLRALRTARAAASGEPAARRARFAAQATGLCAVLAAVAVLFTVVPVLLLPVCS